MKGVTTEELETPKGKVLEKALKRAVFSRDNVLAQWRNFFFCIREDEVMVTVAAFS